MPPSNIKFGNWQKKTRFQYVMHRYFLCKKTVLVWNCETVAYILFLSINSTPLIFHCQLELKMMNDTPHNAECPDPFFHHEMATTNVFYSNVWSLRIIQPTDRPTNQPCDSIKIPRISIWRRYGPLFDTENPSFLCLCCCYTSVRRAGRPRTKSSVTFRYLSAKH